jgi:hypothetical protein
MPRRAVLILALLASTAALAGNLTFLKGSAISRFDAEDMDLMLKNADEVLSSETANAKREWNNPKTGSSGFAEVREQFVSKDGKSCKRLRVGNKAQGTTAKEATYTLCKHDDAWMVDSGAVRPASDKP